jgi:hypothetical protein
MSVGLASFTIAHVVISLIGIASGFVVARGMLNARRLESWTRVFLAATLATTVTGFLFPFEKFLPSHATGILSLVVLPIAIFALYRKRLAGPWRWVYVVAALIAQYLNTFVLVVQLFLKVPALHALAPTQTEVPFAAAQGVVLLLFVVLTVAAIRRFRPAPRPSPLAP